MLEAIKTNIFRAAVVLAAAIVVLTSAAPVANAAIYGQDTKYGECSYGSGCSRPTVVTTPQGLQVSINLHDGQTIPQSGYTVIATPLNGEGRTFDHVEFWLDGVLVFTAKPGSNGTARWDWDPKKFPGTQLKVIVFDTDGTASTQEFNLTIGPAITSTSPPATGPTPNQDDSTVGQLTRSVTNFVAAVVNTYENILEGAAEFFKAIPAPVVFFFPYFLLLMILVNVALLLLQARGEVREYAYLKSVLARGVAVNDAKQTLAQLVSHYLRTPLTLMMGGVDMLKDDPTAQSAVSEFETMAKRLHEKIEDLIKETVSENKHIPDSMASPEKQASVWRQKGLFLPLVLAPLILIPYNMVAVSAGAYSSAEINLATQIIIFCILITMSYILLRQHQLRKRNAEHVKDVIKAEVAINHSRDDLITKTLETLESDITAIDALMEKVGDTPATEFLRTGLERFKELMSKLRVANRLRGLRSEAAATDVEFADIANKAIASLQEKAAERGIKITAKNNAKLRIQSPDLVAYVIQSLVDNAVAYSDQNEPIELNVKQDGKYAILSVTDKGLAIPEQDLTQIFQPFHKAEGAEVFTHEGMGFSLYLDKLIADYVGGVMDVSSGPRGETTFSLRMPNQISQ
jgi:signal transduction histidine kinase